MLSKATTISNEVVIATIVDVLRLRAETQRDDIAYRFLADGEEERSTLTYGELYRRARRVAAELQKQTAPGQRALLLDSSEADYIVTFFGCLCAGVIAVPIYAPRLNKKGNARVESVVADAQPSVVLTAGAGSPAVRDAITAAAGEHVRWIDTHALAGNGDESWTPPAVRGADIAFLQYTSGSTAAPKGVMVSHANILDNERMIQSAFATKPGSVIVGWLPLFHDMGLIGNVLQPLYAGVPSILMSPVAFLQRPLRWLQAISRYRATTSGGPNFAYELCLRKIRAEDRSGLDLSSWRVAFNGAEPVRLETLNRFAAQFADCGFRREAFVPCYGLAEATLFVSGGLDSNGVTTVDYGANGNAKNGGSGNGASGNGAKISQKQGKLLVASGRPPAEQDVRIVSPDSLRPSSAGEVGEIWISGPSVAQGYWRKAKETEETFNARLPGTDEGPFLRTGDLGFLQDGHLFITGRLKDLLIIRGQNYYPQDIELTVEQSHAILQPGSGAAFSVEIEGEERLVVVQEVAVRKGLESIVQSDLDELDALIKLIARNIVAGHELQAFAIVLIRKGTIPKTSSGKIQRHACRNAFLHRELYVLREWQERKQSEPALPKPSHPELDGQGRYGLAAWIAQEISRTQGIEQERVDLNQPFAAYGLDSLAAIEFAHKLQAEFQVQVDVAEFFGDSTIAEVLRRAAKNTPSPVRKAEKEQPRTYPLSYGQRALWFVHQTAPESAAYNIARVMRIATGLDVDALRLAFQALADRHPGLRTTVVEVAGEPVQQVAEKAEVCFEYFDARDWSQVELEKALVQQSRRPFSLPLGPLFRTALYARSEKEYLLHIAVHHLVADYWSLTLLLDEMGKLYQAFANQAGTDLVPLEYSYADFVEWQREKLSGPAGERLRDYWKSELAGELAPLSLPADHSRPPVQTFRGASLPFSLDARLTQALKRLGEEQQATLFTTLLAAFQVLLYRLTSQKQVIVGCPIAGRSRAEFANILGYFVNTVPLRADFEQRQTFTEFLSQVRNRVAQAFAHELYPFALMVEQLGIVRDPAVPPIFQSAFVLQQTYGSRSEDFVRFALGQPQARVTLGGLPLEHVALEQRTAQFDLTLTVGEGPDGIVGAWEYSNDLFEQATIARWAECFSILLEEIISHADISVRQLPILSRSQYDQLVEELNRTKLEYDSGQCLHELIEEQVAKTPEAVAVVFGESKLTYGELNGRANRLAHYLRKQGVVPEGRVAICVERSVEMVVAMLAVLKAGGCYVPLDPAHPEERLQFMVKDTQAAVVLTQPRFAERMRGSSAHMICVEDEWGEIARESDGNPEGNVSPGNLAYVIYTSGSTGQPKGVGVSHGALANLVHWHLGRYGTAAQDRMTQFATVGFDAAVWEVWPTLVAGASLYIVSDTLRLDPDAYLQWMQKNQITISFLPTPVAEAVLKLNWPEAMNLRFLLTGGDQLHSVSSVSHEFVLLNHYGPTENTVVASMAEVEWASEDTPSIGRPIANTQIYVTDEEMQLVPVGVAGELCIGGASLARGYLNRPAMTAENFVPDPFSRQGGERLYRTGDRARWLRDGTLQFLGRLDRQVKVRGFRIELGEIENALQAHPGIEQAVVLVREDAAGEKRLVAYYTASGIGEAEAASVGAERLRAHLSAVLPDYMVPAAYMCLDRLPLTPNGKLDRQALPAPEQDTYAAGGYEAPVGEMETKLAEVWAEVLKLEKVGRHNNFFELGGHSLLATRVISRIREGFHVELPIHSLFQNPTVARLALQVDKAARTAAPPLRALPREQSPRLSFAQERLWFLSRYEAEASLYNVSVALRLRGPLNREALHAGLQEIVARHEVLRTSFPETDGMARQNIASAVDLSMPVVEMVESEMPKFLLQQARLPFDLATGPLIRACLLELGNQDHVLLVVMHHIVSDGWSLGVMLREFNVLYDSFSRGAASPLQPLPIQYADYSEWQREWLQGEVLERQLDYWRKQLAGHETLNLPTDRPYPARPTLAGAMETSRLPEPLLSKLKLFSDQQGVTLFMTLLAGFEILLYRYTGQTDISVGSAIANRSRQELEPLIGFFVNTLVLRTQFTEDSSVAELLQRVRDVSLQAYAHQDIPFERLVEALHPVRELGRTPFFQVLFALQNAPLPKVTWNGLEATAGIVETGTAKFDLTLSAREEDGELELSLEYRTELFNAERMKRLLEHYRTLLEGMIVSLDARISELEILMVPAALRQLDTMPLTTNGRADRKALLELESQEAREEAGSLTLTPTEELITGVWSSLLGKSEIGRDDNFFDLGGHSLTSIQMLARLEKVFHREIELPAIFEFPVLKDFSAYVDRLAGPAPLATLQSIVPASRDRDLPLSFAQQRLWFLAQMEGGNEAYNVPFGLHLKGDLNRTAFGRALDRIVVRHEVLRTTFAFRDGEPVQEIGAVEASSFRLLEHDLRGHNDVEAELATLGELEAGAPFDLQAGPLIRGRLIRLAEDEHVLLITMHHIVSDGWSMGVLVRELNALYRAYGRGEADPLPELEIQYADYAVWQRQWIEGEILQQQAAYWKTTLAGAPALLELPTDHPRPVEQSYAGAALPVVLEEKLTAGLKDLSRRQGTTLYMTLLAGWAILLARLSGQQDVVIGSPVANRGRAEIENLIGFFVNTLALRLDLSGSPSVSELLEQTKAQSLAAQRHQDIPFEQVVDLLQPVRSLAHSPLFQVMFSWQNAVESSLELPGLEVLLLQPPHKVAQFDLTLFLREEEETIAGGIEYATSRFEPATIERYLGYFRTLLEAMVADDTQAVHRLSMIPGPERYQLLYQWNDTKTEFPADKCLHQLFEERAAQRPEAVAVLFEDQELTYEDLNFRANQLGNYLVKLGVGPEVKVGVCMERSLEMVVGLLGVLKAGAAYVPLDPVYPVDRLTYMAQDARIEVLLTQSKFRKRLPDYAGRLIELDVAGELIASESGSSLVSGSKVIAENLAYVIYTSGSTGKPKGVAVEHRQVCNQLFWTGDALSLGLADRVLQKGSFSVDTSILEIFLPLARGAQIIIAKPGGERDVDYLVRLAIEKAVTYFDLVPALLEQMLEHPRIKQWTSLRVMSCGGEILRPELVRAFYQSLPGELWNAYGPTEATVQSTFTACKTEEGQNVPIGRPIANTQIYILDACMQPVPQGVTGELYIGGAGVARGYLNRPELTAEKFLADPFAVEAGARMYRTGDLVRWLSDGNIEFFGRNDYQVKIRGFRIELGEIEARLAEQAGVREAVVVAREKDGEKRLVAYYVPEETATEIPTEVLRSGLSGVLPDHMVPAAYVKLERLPLTPNGKLDRRALPAPEQEAYAVRGYEAPVGEMETKLAAVWAEVLKLEKVGRHDNFFDLGGHSLLAVRVVSRLQQVLNVEVAIRDLFAHSELADLARHLQGAAHAELPRIMPAKRSGRLPLSFAQQRLWFMAQMEGASVAYHVPFGLHLKGDLNRTAFGRALDRIVVRHEVLRTTFAFRDGEPVQEIGAVEASSFRLLEHDLRGHNAVEAELTALSEQEVGASFDLEAGPLIRGRLIRLAEDEHVLLVTMHHIVSDGWSMGVLADELNALYGAFLRGEADPLPELEIQYADYAVWQRQWIEGEILQQQAAYWKTTLAGAPALLELPMDRVRPVQQSYAGATLPVVLDEKLTSGLKGLSRSHGTTLYMTLLAGWAISLMRLSGQQDVVIGSPVANRGRAEIENLIGFFVNTLALRLDLSGSPSVSELLQQTKEQSLAAQRHQDIPFEQVVELAQPVRSLAHSPLFQVMFAWQNAAEARLELPGLEVQLLPSAFHRVAKFDLTLQLQEVGDTIGGFIEYASALFEAATVHRFIGYFLALLKAMVADDVQTIDRLPMLSEEEREQVLYGWNETKAEFSSEKCVHELFEEQVRRSPQATAVVFEKEELSYGELNERANRLAHYLRELGVQPDERVAICVERGFEMIVGLLAILKAGGAYVPLDPSYPEERLKYMLADSAPAALLMQGHLARLTPGISEAFPVLDLDDASGWSDKPDVNPKRAAIGITPENLAYIIYTSGSMGQPKGVMVPHRAINRLVLNNRYAKFEASDRVAFASNPAFDAATMEVWAPLLNGGSMVVIEQSVLLDAAKFGETLKRQAVNILWLTVGLFNQYADALAEQFSGLRYLIVGGDALDPRVIGRVIDGHRPQHLLNGYGPTETTTFAITHEVNAVAEKARSIPIGRPIGNTRAYILGEQGEPTPIGVAGELYIGGEGLARGYLNRTELTAERFVPDPFTTEAGARLYKTGDLARWQADGNIDFVGRNDNQVKIRGFRIELGEIETRLTEYPEVREAVVLAREDEPGDKRLVAYYTASDMGKAEEASVGAEQLRAHLSAVVPDYMVPAAYVRMDRLPLTPNGKVDRRALPAPEQEAYAVSGYEAPVGEIETKLAEVWAEVLHLEKVGRHDNFFDLGGHSLLAVQVVSDLQQVLSVEVEIDDLFAHAELADLARHLQGAAHAELSRIMPAKRSGRLPLSFAQQRLWFLGQMEGASAAYHIPFGLHLKGDLNRTALRRALDRIVVRHEVLRTTFAFRDGEPVQEIGAVDESSFRLIEHDLRGHNDVEAELATLGELEAGAPFDLAAGPLIRGRLIRLAEDEHVLLITMHHIVSDGWSMGVLVRELNALYGAYGRGESDPLPELEIQYADYAVWQRQWIEGEILQQQAAYWKTTLAGAPALLELPTDHPRPIRRDFTGGFVELVLDEQLTAGLKDLGRRQGTTLYMTLLSGWAILLARLSGQQDVVIGSPVANRGRAEIENLIGFFVNTLALRLDLSGSPSVSELLEQTKAQSLAAQRHQDIPFEQVVELAQPVRSLAHSPLFQVMFAWQDATESLLELPGLELQPFVRSSQRVAKFDMTLSLRATGNTIVGGIEYASPLFEAASVHRYIGYFVALLRAMVADDAQAIDRLPMISEREREQVLYGWNETQADFSGGKCVHELFEEQVARTPQAAAVIYEEERLNYGELNERANRLAWRLRELGVGPETIVGLMVERSIEMVVALLGVLKAGAAYVPLDPGSTRERLKYMVEDSGARLVLSSASLSSIISAAKDVEVLSMEAQEWLLYRREDPQVSVEPSQLAYVIYTSGSTGRPKGVGVEHRQLVNYVQAIGRKLQIEPGARLGLVSTFAADLGYTMIFPALCHGGCLDVVDADRVLDASKLEEHFSRHPIDYLKIVPSHLRALLNSNAGSGFLPRRWLVLGGEASSWDLIQQVKERGAGCRVLNHYGPTETTVGVLTCDTTPSDSTQDGGGLQAGGMVPIGRPLSNGKVYILDSELNPVGAGVSGEIYIAGAGVARGYLKREDLTAEKFLANPYSVEPGGRMYRTGDLGRYLENGNVEFLGRRDHQVKIRGFRIELGEIEARLAEHPEVREAVVLAREDASGEKRLVAYVVPERESEESNNGSGRAGLQMSELRQHLLDKLPEYMVPGAYVQLNRVPLTPNGKIDRKSLPEPDKDIQEQEYVGPRNAAEETLCHLWKEVLRRERVGIHDNFFNIGGHSLLAVQVISCIKQAFAIEMPLSVLFAAPTVARMAEHIAAVNEPDRSQSSPVLVNIQPHGSRPPFFCVHAVGGQVISYGELSRELGDEQPFYGLQSPPANCFPESDISIEQLATLYNQEIRSVQPVGPYLLSGWSMGGLVAWEMAQQLMKEGETIGLLALIDTAPPPRYREAEDRDDEISMLAHFAMDMSRLVGRDPGPLVKQFLQAAEQDQWKMVQDTLTNYGVLAPQTAHAEMTALFDVFTRNSRAMNNYSLHPSDQSVVYFRASETPKRFSKVWTKWAGGGIQFHSVPGDHFTMLRRPGVRVIAETLQRYLLMNNNNELRAVNPESTPVS